MCNCTDIGWNQDCFSQLSRSRLLLLIIYLPRLNVSALGDSYKEHLCRDPANAAVEIASDICLAWRWHHSSVRSGVRISPKEQRDTGTQGHTLPSQSPCCRLGVAQGPRYSDQPWVCLSSSSQWGRGLFY